MPREATTKYFSGQGIVYLDDGTGLVDVGNVAELKLSFETQVLEHKESRTGNRLIDMRMGTDKSCTASITLDSFDPETLKKAMYATITNSDAGTGVAESITAKLGKVIPLSKIKLASLVIKDDADTITYELDKNYTVNLEAGSVYIMTAAEQTAAGAANSIAESDVLHCVYNHAAQSKVDAFKGAEAEYILRFEGLNTADGNDPVVVTIPRFRPTPLKDLSLITGELNSFVMEGAALAVTSTGEFVTIQMLQ